MSGIAWRTLRLLQTGPASLLPHQLRKAYQLLWWPRCVWRALPATAPRDLAEGSGQSKALRPTLLYHAAAAAPAAAAAAGADEPNSDKRAAKPRGRRPRAQPAESGEVESVSKSVQGHGRRPGATAGDASSINSGGSSSRGGRAASSSSSGSRASSAAAEAVEAGPETMEHLLIVDASALLYRAHHASLGPGGRLTNKHGEDTSVLYRFFRSLFILLEGPPPPTHFAVVLDSGGTTFRHDLDPGYKATRERCPTQVSDAANKLRWILPLMGIPVVKEVGWEADDLIGILATQAVESGLRVAVASPDKDFLQLLRPGLELLRMPVGTAGKAKYTSAPYTHLDFERDYGIPPQQYAVVLALAGDPVDSIPGLPSIGEKTAIALLQQFGSLQAVLDGAEQVKRKPVREALLAPGAAQLVLTCLQIASIRCDEKLPSVGHPPDHWRLRAVDEAAAAAAVREFEWLGFRTLMAPLQAHLARLDGAAA